ncbi:hotdog fold thioesterase [Pseudooceanicola sp. 216_PA32_1]|uniref:Hotdog fold thioesterase n=1 Tax=Pseudooceanicola pacificus TaxID=2676438 RepID=A0A844WGS5_9RHOB|nr:PaaI family thioesterase [Pseudooceanicola pacificus]MWB79399.1 hotdog fold thioesterase [Pseudooceanicola pacificus]
MADTEFDGTIQFTAHEVTGEIATGEMPVQPGILNPFGTVHAGAMIWFADVIATRLVLGGVSTEKGMKGFPLAVNLSANLLANTTEGTLTARAEYVKRGRRLSVVRTAVFRADGRQLIDVTTSHVPSE